jgi:hypothetical protein
MNNPFLCWLLWNHIFVIGWLPICHLLLRCLHKSLTFYKISCMHSVLNNGEQHNTTIAMMVMVGCILWSCWLCFCKGKNYYLCFYKGKLFWACGVFFYLLNLIVILHANKLYGLQWHYFLSLHDFL